MTMTHRPYTSAEGYLRLDPTLVAGAMTARGVEPKMTRNEQTGRMEQKRNRQNIPQWTVRTLFTPLADDREHDPETVPVTIASTTEPVIQENTPIVFEGFAAYYYTRRSANGYIRTYRSFMADGFHQDEADDGNGEF